MKKFLTGIGNKIKGSAKKLTKKRQKTKPEEEKINFYQN